MGGHRGRTKEPMAWSHENEHAFVGILYDRVKSGVLQTSTFTKDEWGRINLDMIEKTKMDYGIDRLKGKWNRLRSVHRMFSDLLGHTGVTWDPNTNQVIAAEEVWQHFYTINKDTYKLFRKEGCKNYETLGEIFRANQVIFFVIDQFYLVDSGYPNMPGFLAPYRGRRYHLRDYVGRGRPRGKEELFNYRHSSCRNIIERCIGVLKARFPILKYITNYPLTRQRQIPTACCALHNFIRQEDALDRLFTEYSVENMIFPEVPGSSEDQDAIQFDASQTGQMAQVRDEIATQMWNEYSRRSV